MIMPEMAFVTAIRGVKRVADIPDNLKANEAGQCKYDKVLHEAGRRVGANQQHEQSTPDQHANLVAALAALLGKLLCRFLLRRQFGWLFSGWGLANGLNLRGRRRYVISPAFTTVAPRITSSSMLMLI